jgi:ferritin-like protein
MKSLKDLKKENIQDLPQIILMLKDAFCEEMLAHYQYIILADFVEGVDEPLLKKIVADFVSATIFSVYTCLAIRSSKLSLLTAT